MKLLRALVALVLVVSAEVAISIMSAAQHGAAGGGATEAEVQPDQPHPQSDLPAEIAVGPAPVICNGPGCSVRSA